MEVGRQWDTIDVDFILLLMQELFIFHQFARCRQISVFNGPFDDWEYILTQEWESRKYDSVTACYKFRFTNYKQTANSPHMYLNTYLFGPYRYSEFRKYCCSSFFDVIQLVWVKKHVTVYNKLSASKCIMLMHWYEANSTW